MFNLNSKMPTRLASLNQISKSDTSCLYKCEDGIFIEVRGSMSGEFSSLSYSGSNSSEMKAIQGSLKSFKNLSDAQKHVLKFS